MSKTYDPCMHTAEHILNQTMIRKFNCGRDFRAHIEKKKSKCDYHFDGNITETDIAEIEKRVNEHRFSRY
jgi:misacylated tRNA(Ala) deacylase